MKSKLFVIVVLLHIIYLLFSWVQYGTSIVHLTNVLVAIVAAVFVYNATKKIDMWLLINMFSQALLLVASFPYAAFPIMEYPNNLAKTISVLMLLMMLSRLNKYVKAEMGGVTK
jgi:hypothetical protein